jgi:hypothetical protein
MRNENSDAGASRERFRWFTSPRVRGEGAMRSRKERRMPKPKYPRGLTHEQWLALPQNKRRDLTMRARCDLMGSFRHCKHKLCRRARTCSGDADACLTKLWRLIKNKPKTLRSEYARLAQLPYA